MIAINSKLMDIYLNLISRLGYNNQLEFIARLSTSMKTTQKIRAEKSISHLFGAFETEETAEE
jgi:hypothetical protein